MAKTHIGKYAHQDSAKRPLVTACGMLLRLAPANAPVMEPPKPRPSHWAPYEPPRFVHRQKFERLYHSKPMDFDRMAKTNDDFCHRCLKSAINDIQFGRDMSPNRLYRAQIYAELALESWITEAGESIAPEYLKHEAAAAALLALLRASLVDNTLSVDELEALVPLEEFAPLS